MFNIRNHYKLLVKKYSLIHVTWKFKLRISYGLPGSAWHCSQLCVRKAHMMIRRQKTITHKNNYKI